MKGRSRYGGVYGMHPLHMDNTNENVAPRNQIITPGNLGVLPPSITL